MTQLFHLYCHSDIFAVLISSKVLREFDSYQVFSLYFFINRHYYYYYFCCKYSSKLIIIMLSISDKIFKHLQLINIYEDVSFIFCCGCLMLSSKKHLTRICTKLFKPCLCILIVSVYPLFTQFRYMIIIPKDPDNLSFHPITVFLLRRSSAY